jgi:hypothetical protein
VKSNYIEASLFDSSTRQEAALASQISAIICDSLRGCDGDCSFAFLTSVSENTFKHHVRSIFLHLFETIIVKITYTILNVAFLLLVLSLPQAEAQVLRYTFDEACSGTTTALDSGTLPAANGSFAGASTRVPGVGGSVGALDLSANGGLGNWMTAGDADKLDNMSGITISMWVNLRGATSNYAFLASDAILYQTGWTFRIYGSTPSASSFSMEIGKQGSLGGQMSITSLDADHKWIMLAGTFDNNSHLMTISSGSLTSSMVGRGGSVVPGYTLGDNTAEFQVGKVFSSSVSYHIHPCKGLNYFRSARILAVDT